MPITRNLQGAGTSAAQARAIVGSSDRGKTATGTTRTDAYLLSEDVTIFTTVPSGTGCALRTNSLENDIYTVVNQGANAINVYPPTTGQIGNGSVGAAYSVAAGTFAEFQSLGADYFMPRMDGASSLAALAAPNGSSLIGYISAYPGAVATTDQEKLREMVSPLDFGAVGDGSADDRANLLLALSSGRVVDGAGKTYGISGNLELPINFKGLINCTLKQLTPTGSDRRTIYASGCSDFVIGKVIIDRNGNTSGGSIGDDAGIYLANCTNFYTYQCEAFGGGAGSGITYQSCSNFEDHLSRVHDIKYITGSVPSDDVINGFWYNNCHDFTSVSSNVYDCGAVVAGIFTKKRSRGVAVSGCYNFNFYSPNAARVDQGHDITGSVGNHDFSITGGISTDCYSYGFKAANSAYRGRYINCTSVGARMNFVVSGQTSLSDPKPRDIEYVNCISVDAGKNSNDFGIPAHGFRIESNGAVDPTYPRGVIYSGCIAVDTQGTPTMDYGFVSDVVTGNDPADINRIVNNCRASGFISAATSGFNEDNNITTTSRLDGATPRNVMFETDAGADMKMWDTVLASGVMESRTRTDTDGAGTTWRRLTRGAGTTITRVQFPTTLRRGGDVVATRYEESDDSGGTTQRVDDNSMRRIAQKQNYGVTAAGQGVSYSYQFGVGGAFGDNGVRTEFRTTDDWSTAGKRSAEFRTYTLLGGVEFESLRANPRYAGYGAKPMAYSLGKSAVTVSHTGTTAKTVKATIPVPASAIGPNGVIRFNVLFSMTSNANNKTFNVEYDGNIFYGITLANQSALQAVGYIRNRNSETSQVGFTNSTGGIGAASLVTASVDSTLAKNLTIAITLANSGDTASIEAYDFDISYGA